MPPKKTKTSAGMETVDQTVARAKALQTPMSGTVSADDLVNPPAPVNPPVPNVNTNDGSRTNTLIGNVATSNDTYITAKSEEAAKAKEISTLLGSQTFDGAGERSKMGNEFGLPDNLARLGDIQTQLAQRNTESKVTQSRIEGGAGQTLGQAQREVTQEQREASIRDAGLAAEASVLQGNIETASTLINQAMSDYYQDRQLTNQNMIQQLDYFSGIADEQTKQLLQKEQRAYEKDQKAVERTIEAVDQAVTSGAALPEEMRLLTDPKTTDQERLSIAQSITGRASKALYDSELYGKYLSNAIKQKELDTLENPVVVDPTKTSPETLKAVDNLTDGQRTAITSSRETINELDRMIALVETSGDMSLLSKATPEGREFLRLRQNVVDKLARQRTGAVVGADEEETFKEILGVGWFDMIAKDDTEVLNGLKKFRSPHEEALNLNDPEGKVRNFLDSQKVSEDDEEINAIFGIPTSTPSTSVSSYFK